MEIMTYRLITANGKEITFYTAGLASTYRDIYGGEIFVEKVENKLKKSQKSLAFNS